MMSPGAPPPVGVWRAAWVVWLKELVDTLRDRRTLLVVLLSSVALGPVMLGLMSRLVADLEEDLGRRDVHVIGLAQAPTLANYLARQGLVLHEAPPDAAQALADGQLAHPLLQVPPDFEPALAQGLAPRLLVLTHSGQRRVDTAAAGLQRHLQGFVQEQASLRLVLRGVPPALLQAVRVDELDAAEARERGAQFTRMLPMFVLMAVMYGALAAALDSTAGERERGSLEPLLCTAAPARALVLGKWGAVAAMGMLVALCACLGFLPAQALMRSERLAALFHYGPVQAAMFLALLLPLAALVAAVLMAVALRCRSHKEAQASASVVLLAASLAPMLSLLGPGAEPTWQRWVPVLAQTLLMQRVLAGTPLGAADLLVPLGVAAVGTALGLALVARQLKGEVWR